MRGFVPRPLPPVPEVDFREGLRRPLEAATTALGRLDAVTELLPDANVFVYGYVRKEAVLSSQIEGTQSSLADLERFIHATDDGLPVLVKAGLAHVQFETIHPFLDGNGRLGRLLITLMLCDAGLLREPLLYLSLYFKRNRSTYYQLLNDTRHTGDWEAWLRFFLEGVRDVAEGAVATARSASETIRDDRARIAGLGRRAGSALRVHQSLVERPIGGIARLASRTGLSAPTVATVLQLLARLGIVREITGRQRGRVFTYERYLAVLREGTEDPPG